METLYETMHTIFAPPIMFTPPVEDIEYEEVDEEEDDVPISTAPRSMHMVSEKEYKALAIELLDRIYTSDYFSGIIDIEKASGMLDCTLIVYRERDGDERITDIVPVWWEYRVIDEDGVDVDNDFNWSDFKQYLT